jgi:hypothetical protein
MHVPQHIYREWLSADLVRIRAEVSATGRLFEHIDKAGMHFRGLPRFFPLFGTTLADAVSAARAVSGATARMAPRIDPAGSPLGYAAAIAVLQAPDGGYWGTVLGTGSGRRGVPMFDPSFPYTRIRSIEALHPDVRAVVGVRDDVRFLPST